jgi:hypothetical protein
MGLWAINLNDPTEWPSVSSDFEDGNGEVFPTVGLKYWGEKYKA